jgi:hypothetical protein
MTCKTLLPNQCTPLHFLYGQNDCCLCHAHKEIEDLKAEIEKLKAEKIEKETNEK